MRRPDPSTWSPVSQSAGVLAARGPATSSPAPHSAWASGPRGLPSGASVFCFSLRSLGRVTGGSLRLPAHYWGHVSPIPTPTPAHWWVGTQVMPVPAAASDHRGHPHCPPTPPLHPSIQVNHLQVACTVQATGLGQVVIIFLLQELHNWCPYSHSPDSPNHFSKYSQSS